MLTDSELMLLLSQDPLVAMIIAWDLCLDRITSRPGDLGAVIDWIDFDPDSATARARSRSQSSDLVMGVHCSCSTYGAVAVHTGAIARIGAAVRLGRAMRSSVWSHSRARSRSQSRSGSFGRAWSRSRSATQIGTKSKSRFAGPR